MALMVGNPLVIQLYTDLVVGFEGAFEITSNGTLRCNSHARERAAAWFNFNKILIMTVTGVDVYDMEFVAPAGRGDIGTANENKRIMLQYYALGFAAYMKYSQTLAREVSRRFCPRPRLEEAVDGE
jgi:hypothetical protein